MNTQNHIECETKAGEEEGQRALEVFADRAAARQEALATLRELVLEAGEADETALDRILRYAVSVNFHMASGRGSLLEIRHIKKRIAKEEKTAAQ